MKSFTISTSIVALMMGATGVRAQDKPAPAPTPAVQPDTGIADIIVTAAHREASLQNVAIPVTAIGSAALQERGVVSVTDLTKLAPAIKIGQLAGSSTQVTIRGVGNAGGNAFADAGVGFNLDGVYLARTTGASGIFYDVNRVEVLKGPQGTLYGRNSTGGVVNVITNDPEQRLGVDFTGEYGNANHVRVTGAVNIPLSDTLALRVAGNLVHSDGFTPEGAGAEDSKAARIKLKFTPGTAFSLLLQADYTRVRDGANIGGYLYPGFNPFKDLGCGPTSLQNTLNPAVVAGAALPIKCDSFNNNTQLGFSGTANYNFGPATATLIVAHRRSTANYLHYGAGFPVADDNRNDPSHYTTAELRLASNFAGPLKLQVGTFYFNEDNRSSLQFNQAATYQNSNNISFRTKSISAFGEATYAFTPAVRLTLGGRYTSDIKTLGGSIVSPIGSTTVIPSAVPTPGGIINPLAGVIAGTCLAGGGTYSAGTTYGLDDAAHQFAFPNGTCNQPISGHQTFNKFTWKVGVEADLGSHSLAYAAVSTGFRSGGFIAALDGGPTSTLHNYYQPETITSYTIGIKNRFLDNRIQLNLEGFYYAYKNKQLSHLGPVFPSGFNNVVDNAGSATLYGLEAEAIFKPTPNDLVSVDLQYEHTRYDSLKFLAEYAAVAGPTTPPTTTCSFSGVAPVPNSPFNSANVDCSGRPISYSPQWVLNMAYRHTFNLGNSGKIVFGASTQIQSYFWLGEEYIATERQAATMISDANLSWKAPGGHFTVTGYINNIENKRLAGAEFLSSGGARLALRQPRTYGVRLNVTF